MPPDDEHRRLAIRLLLRTVADLAADRVGWAAAARRSAAQLQLLASQEAEPVRSAEFEVPAIGEPCRCAPAKKKAPGHMAPGLLFLGPDQGASGR